MTNLKQIYDKQTKQKGIKKKAVIAGGAVIIIILAIIFLPYLLDNPKTKKATYFEGSLDRIEIHTVQNDVYVYGTDDEDVEIYYPQGKYLTYQISQDEKSISYSEEYKGLSFRNKSNSVLIYIPNDQIQDFVVSTESGRVHFSGCDVSNISVSSTEGNLSGSMIKADTISFKSQSGAIDLWDAQIGKCTGESDSGMINSSDSVFTDFIAKSNSGMISLYSIDFDSLAIDSESGSVYVSLPHDRNEYSIDINSLSSGEGKSRISISCLPENYYIYFEETDYESYEDDFESYQEDELLIEQESSDIVEEVDE